MNTLTIIMLWLALATPAWATPINLSFATSDGLASGTFAYDTSAALLTTNSLGGSVYSLTAWDFRADGNSTALPLTTFSSDVAGHTGQLCVGSCTFAAPQQMRIDFRGEGFWFFASFNITQPLTTPPTFEQIGAFGQASYRPQSELVPLRVWGNSPGSTATLTQAASVPEPSTLFLLAVAFGLMAARVLSMEVQS